MLIIREPYNKAGRVWGFEPPLGVGIEVSHFDGEGRLFFVVNSLNAVYSVDKHQARKFIKEKQSIERIGRTVLWILPLSICTELTQNEAS